MKNFKIVLTLAILILLSSCTEKKPVHIIHVTDVHGYFFPFDYKTGKIIHHSMSQIYTFVDSLRGAGEEVIIIDTGDLLQGTPMVYYFNKIDTSVMNPAAAVYNFMNLTAMVVGNHDIEQGPDVYGKFQRELQAPMLSANAFNPDGSTAFPPYTIINAGGFKIGLIGLTTPAIPLWLSPDLYPGISWGDISESIRPLVEELRPQVDFLIAGIHAGIDTAYSLNATAARNLPPENDALRLVRENPELDLVLLGHEHRLIPGKYYENSSGEVPLSMPRNASYYFNEIIIGDDQQIVVKPHKTSDYKANQAFLSMMQPYHVNTLAYINESLTELGTGLDMHTAYYYDNALLDLIQKVQLESTGADVSFAACFSPWAELKPGTIKIKDIFGIYRYENYLYGIKMSGVEIKNYLERSAVFFTNDPENQLTDPDFPGFNFDVAENVKYTIDLSKPVGKRIVIRSIAGELYQPDKQYKVALNSYRFNGGGGHLKSAGNEAPEAYWVSDAEIRNLIIEYLKKGGTIPVKPDNNWKIVGFKGLDEKVKTYVEKFRKAG